MTAEDFSEASFELSLDAIDLLFPMHVAIDNDGKIERAGPTVLRMFGDRIVGQGFFAVFHVEKPRRLHDIAGLHATAGERFVISAAPDGGDKLRLRGIATAVGYDRRRMLIDLSFGSNLAEAVQRFDLKGKDFKPNDLSIDLYYTFQTQQTLLEDSRKMAEALSVAKEEAERKACLDPLTGIANHRALHGLLSDLLHRPEREQAFALLHIDLDRFKSINDTFGHAAGDAVLRNTATILQAHAGATDMAARIGGDEFALVLVAAPDTDGLKALAKRILDAVSAPVRTGPHSCQVGASIGIVRFYPGETATSDQLMIQSDIALYDAKVSGNTARILSSEMLRRHDETNALVADIKTGLAEKQFVPFFQPQIDTRQARVCGLEVLARWNNPSQGMLTPGRFIETAIHANLLEEIDQQVRHQAFLAFADWRRAGFDIDKLSINVTASNLRSPGFIEILLDELFLVGLDAGLIQLELLESILFEQSDQFLFDQCRALNDAGFTLALDDFGTGHSSIATLIEAPISMLKIDRSFVSGLDRNAKMQRITGSMLAMADYMQIGVLAEGVETRAEFDILNRRGCRFFQGYYFCKPKPWAELSDWLSDRAELAAKIAV